VTHWTPWGRAERGSVTTVTTSLYLLNLERGVREDPKAGHGCHHSRDPYGLSR